MGMENIEMNKMNSNNYNTYINIIFSESHTVSVTVASHVIPFYAICFLNLTLVVAR